MTERAETKTNRDLQAENGCVTPLKAERIQLVVLCHTDRGEGSLTTREERDRRLEAGWRRRTVEDNWRPRRRCA